MMGMKLYEYECVTTFWDDFSIADAFGVSAVQDTFDRAFSEWKDNYLYLTELVMVTNHKLWEHYSRHNEGLSRLYEKLFFKAQEYALEHLNGEELTYFLRTTD